MTATTDIIRNQLIWKALCDTMVDYFGESDQLTLWMKKDTSVEHLQLEEDNSDLFRQLFKLKLEEHLDTK